MAQTLTSLLIHIVFSTKDRVPIITPEVEPDLFAYIGGILKNNSSPLLAAGGTSDHVHLLVSQSKNIALSVLLKDVKKDSSSWIKTKGEVFRDFHWQDGYGAFSISQSEVPGLKLYIANQKEHHRKQTFQEELIQFLEEYGLSTTSGTCGIESFDPLRVRQFFFRLSVGVAQRSPTAIEFIPFRDRTATLQRDLSLNAEGVEVNSRGQRPRKRHQHSDPDRVEPRER